MMNESEVVLPLSSIEWIPCGYNWTGPILSVQMSVMSYKITGYLACAVAAIFYGCNFIPLKLVNTGDGIFCQWVVCAAIWLVGLFVQVSRGEPQFYSLTVIGGAVWALGNVCAIPIINLVGMSVGVTLWGCTSIAVGWASSRFGLIFDMCPQIPSNEVMNYIGVALCICAVITFTFVRTEISALTECVGELCFDSDDEEDSVGGDGGGVGGGKTARTEDSCSIASAHLNNGNGKTLVQMVNGEKAPLRKVVATSGGKKIREPVGSTVFLGNLSEGWRRAIGVMLAIISGICYGLAFVPWNYVREHTIINGYRASRSGLDYVFTQYCGIFMTSTLIFAVYAVLHKMPAINPAAIVPSFFSGLMWGTATVALFVANEVLSVAITFPIVGAFPGIIASIFGIFLFHEIRGARSFIILAMAFALTISGVILTGWSKHF